MVEAEIRKNRTPQYNRVFLLIFTKKSRFESLGAAFLAIILRGPLFLELTELGDFQKQFTNFIALKKEFKRVEKIVDFALNDVFTAL
jgi:hypothetical protein